MDLGPVFGTAAVSGPITISYMHLQNKHFYSIGEKHTLNGTAHKHVVEYIKEWSDHHPVHMFIEASCAHESVHVVEEILRFCQRTNELVAVAFEASELDQLAMNPSKPPKYAILAAKAHNLQTERC